MTTDFALPSHDVSINVDIEVDACHRPCPMPLLMLKRALKTATLGQVLLLKTTDPHSRQDLPQFCQVHHLPLLHQYQDDHIFYFYIKNVKD